MKNISKILSVFILLAFVACKKDTKTAEPDPIPVQENGSLNVKFENVADTTALQFATKYVNQNGDTFQVSVFKYFISNIVVTKEDNSTYTEPDSYHLIDHSDPATSLINLKNVPAGAYKSISFMLGVDSARSASGAQTGALANYGSMYWTWNSGYIMLKLEGTSPKSGDPAKSLYFHAGGYGGTYKVQRTFNLSFNTSRANVSKSSTPEVHLSADVLEIFKNPSTVDFSTTFDVTSAGSRAKMIADNYADMIRFEHVHN